METPLSVLPLRYGEDAPDYVASETYVPDDAARRDAGQLFLTLRLARPAAFQATLGATIMETLRDAYYGDPTLDASESFERALKMVNERLAQIAEERGPDFYAEFHASIAVLAGNMLHATVAGEGSVYMKRGPMLLSVTDGLVPNGRTPENRKSFFQIASGEVRPSDLLLLATHDLLSITTEHHVRAALQPQNFRTPRLLKAKLGIRDVDLVLLLSGEALGGAPGGTSALMTTAATWTGKLRNAFGGGEAKDEDGAEEHATGGGDLASLYEQPEKPSKISNTWELVKTNVGRSTESFTKRFGGRPLSQRGTRNAAVVALVTILVLAGLLFWGVDARSRSKARAAVVTELEQITEDRNKAKMLSLYDKPTAKLLLASSLQRIAKLRQENAMPDLSDEIQAEEAAIQENMNTVDNIYVRTDPRVVVDLAKERSGAQPLGLFAGGTSIWAYDYNALYKIDLDKVDLRKVELPALPNLRVKAATYMTQNQSVVLYTEDKKVVEYKGGNFEVVETAAEAWRDATAMTEYDQRPIIYLLDSTGNQVWSYQRGRSSYATPTGKTPAGTSLAQASSIAVDGSIYVLSTNGQLLKTYNDKPAPFAFENFSETSVLKTPTQLFTNSNTNNLYILEPETKRVVVTTKGGRYLAQYSMPNVAGRLIGVLAREQEGLLYVLDDTGKLYQVQLEKFDA